MANPDLPQTPSPAPIIDAAIAGSSPTSLDVEDMVDLPPCPLRPIARLVFFKFF